jgi:DNA-binding transcriptional LysR family regulator
MESPTRRSNPAPDPVRLDEHRVSPDRGGSPRAPVIVDTRLLEPFVVLAEELHFGRAAERLHVAQPALSQQIARLELQLGAQLFVRSPRGVEITDAGRALLTRAAPALQELEAGLEAARQVGGGRAGALRIGYLSSLAAPAIPLIAAAFRRRAPAVELKLREATMGRQLEQLRAGRLDVALFSDFEGVEYDRAGLRIDRFAKGPQFFALPAGHPRAGATTIEMGELSGEPFVMPSGTDDSGYRGALIAVARRHGFELNTGPEADNVDTMLGLVSAGFGVTLVAWPTALVPRAEIIFVPVADAEVELVAARLEGAPAASDGFVAVAEEVLSGLVPEA